MLCKCEGGKYVPCGIKLQQRGDAQAARTGMAGQMRQAVGDGKNSIKECISIGRAEEGGYAWLSVAKHFSSIGASTLIMIMSMPMMMGGWGPNSFSFPSDKMW